MTFLGILFLALGTAVGSLLGLKGGWFVARTFQLASGRKLGRRRSDVSRRVPLIGGFALSAGVVMGLYLGTPVIHDDVLLTAGQITGQLRALILGVILLWLGGLAADRQKGRSSTGLLLITQATVILVLLIAGVRIRGMNLWGWDLPAWISAILTAVWLFLMMQFSRFLDGIDGLLPGVALLLAFGQLRIVWGHPEPYALTLGVVSIVAFAVLLAVNWYPAHVYLGNNGSAIPGLLLGMLAIAARTKSFLTASAILPLLIIVLTLGFLGMRVLERTLLSMRLPRWSKEGRRPVP